MIQELSVAHYFSFILQIFSVKNRLSILGDLGFILCFLWLLTIKSERTCLFKEDSSSLVDLRTPVL